MKELRIKPRLDEQVLQAGIAHTLTEAQSFIVQGKILVNGQKVTKPGTRVSPFDQLTPIRLPNPYVSRGWLKMQSAHAYFGFQIQDQVALDIGISTGGFTQYLLQKNARHVVGVDVGHGITDYTLRQNPKLTVIEKTNARYLTKSQLQEATQNHPLIEDIRLVVMDVSFISITKILPAIAEWLSPDTLYIILIKPQFEAQKEEVGPQGIMTNPALVHTILERVQTQLTKNGFETQALIECAIKGTKGNQEYFLKLKYAKTQTPIS